MSITTLPTFVRQRLDPAQRYGLRVTLFALAVILLFAPFGFLLEQVTRNGRITLWDRALVEELHDVVRDHAWTVKPLQFISFLGKPVWFYVLVGAICVFLWQRKRVRLVVYLVTTGIVGGLVDSVVKMWVSRPRPVLEDPVATAFGQSFPSGHAFSATAVYGALLLVFLPILQRRWRPFAIAGYVFMVAAIAFSRLALGVHFMSDVIAGIALGLAWLFASTAAFEIWRVERGQKPTKPLEQGLEPEAKRDLVR